MLKKKRRFRRSRDCAPIFCRANARENVGRGSKWISGKDAKEQLDAAAFAAEKHWDLNVDLVFNPGQAGLTLRDAEVGFRVFKKRLENWMRDHGVVVAFLYFWEQVPTYGLHCHILAHVPPWWRDAFLDWLERPNRLRLTKNQMNPSYVPLVRIREKRSAERVEHMVKYLAKGIGRRTKLPVLPGVRGPATKVLQITKVRNMGYVPFRRRTGGSRAIGKGARAKAREAARLAKDAGEIL